MKRRAYSFSYPNVTMSQSREPSPHISAIITFPLYVLSKALSHTTDPLELRVQKGFFKTPMEVKFDPVIHSDVGVYRHPRELSIQ